MKLCVAERQPSDDAPPTCLSQAPSLGFHDRRLSDDAPVTCLSQAASLIFNGRHLSDDAPVTCLSQALSLDHLEDGPVMDQRSCLIQHFLPQAPDTLSP